MRKELKGLLKINVMLVKIIIKLIAKIIKIVYLLIRTINDLIGKGFQKLPRLLKVSLIYGLIGLSVLNFIQIPNEQPVQAKTENIKVEEKVVPTEEKQVEETTPKTETKTCKFNNEIACKIYEKAIANGLTHEQSVLVVSISAHETGYWKSEVFKNKNNFGGVMGKNGLREYSSLEEGLDHFVNLLTKYYFNEGLTTIEQIGAKYCPVGAENDPNGLNKHWVPSVTSIYNSYLESVK